jgi:hypothetical protein
MSTKLHKSRLSLALALLICFTATAVKVTLAQKQVKITGTFSDMHFVKEPGDLLGTEIKIVFAGGSYQGVLQFAEGGPSELVIVKIQKDGNKISFSISDDNPYAGEFQGSVSSEALQGEFRFKSGGTEKVTLHRGKSYWD